MIQYREINLFRFVVEYEIKNTPKEVIRIIGRTILERTRNVIIVALEDGSIRGYGVVRRLPSKYDFEEKDCPYYVNEQDCGRGTGYGILNNLIMTNGYNLSYHAYVGVNNKSSIKCFERMGFITIGNMYKMGRRFIIVDHPTDFYVLKKELIQRN